jgi:Hypothetical glycosyl hydrolase 6/Beta-galactosidase trimerisation domain
MRLGAKPAFETGGAPVAEDQSNIPGSGFVAPEWLRYSRAVMFDGYSPPLYPHMKDFSAQRLLQTVTELGGNLLRFQPIGYWAYYPTKAFPVHEELGERDLINEVSEQCRQVGVRQYCYIGYGPAIMMTPDYVKEHPKFSDWLLRGPDGEPYGTSRHYGFTPPPHRLCTTGDAYREGLRTVVQEVCSHDIEGVYFDGPSLFQYTGVCFCDSCRTSFLKFSGLDIEQLAWVLKYGKEGLPLDWSGIPADQDIKPLLVWFEWANKLTLEDLQDFRKIAHQSGKFMACHNAGTWVGTSLPLQYRIPDGFMVEASEETYDRLALGMMGASMARPYKKVAQMYLGSYRVASSGGPPEEPSSVVHNTNLEDGDEILLQGFTNLACANEPIYATANRLYFKVGGGSIAPAQEVFALMKTLEQSHKDSIPVPYVTVVPTWESLQRFRTRKTSWNWPLMSQSFVLVMLDERISFDVNPSTEMSDEWLKEQRVIALCGASGISDDDAGRLAAWVQRGGGLLATYDSGLYDKDGQLRKDGGALREILGVQMNGEPLISEPECYYRVLEKHAAMGEYGPGAVIEGDCRLMQVEALPGSSVLAECWNLGTNEVRGPAVVANTYGKGRSIYIGGSLEANYRYDRVKSTGQLFASIMRYLGQQAPMPFKLTAPRGVYGVLRRTVNGDLALWVLADIGFKDAAAGLMRQEFVQAGEIEVSIRIPDGCVAKELRLIRADRTTTFDVKDGYAVTTIPTLHIAEIVHLQLSRKAS